VRYGTALAGRTPEFRPRQLRDEAKSCGSQPANIRVIYRRHTGSAPLGALESTYDKEPLDTSWAGTIFSLDNCQPYQRIIGILCIPMFMHRE
jgi:hypothetical protein